MKQIVITVPKNGFSQGKTQIQVEGVGYTGTQCKTATEAFEQALGTVVEEVEKPEMFQTEQSVERLSE